MKKVFVILLTLAFAAFLLPACAGDSGDGGGGEWMSAGLARAVDQQFGPVVNYTRDAQGNLVAPAALAPNGQDAGTHQVNNLKGVVTPGVVTQVVQNLDFQIGMAPSGWTPLPGKASPLLSKLASLGSGHSVDNNPCNQDEDLDGTPDWQELWCDPVSDPGCTGLCEGGELEASCSQSGNTFTIKFSDCTETWSWITTVTNTTGTTTMTFRNTCADVWQVDCNAASDSVNPFKTWTTTTFNTNIIWNAAGRFSTTTITPCGSTNVRNYTTSITTNTFITTSTCPAVFHCAGALTTTTTDFSTTWTTQVVTASTTYTTTTTTADVWNGAVAIHFGTSNVDEQLRHVRYNNLTHVWDLDGTGSEDTNPMIRLNGQVMEYKVITPGGGAAEGTTGRYLNCGNIPQSSTCGENDGMWIEQLSILLDHDGLDDAGFATGNFRVRHGSDNEDGDFIFSAGSAIVQLADVAWVGPNQVILTFFDRDNLGDYLCETAQGTPCTVTVEFDSALRTYDVLASTCAAVAVGTDIPY